MEMKPFLCIFFPFLIFTAQSEVLYAKDKSDEGKSAKTKKQVQKSSKQIKPKKVNPPQMNKKPKHEKKKEKGKAKKLEENDKTKAKTPHQKAPPRLEPKKTAWEPRLVYDDDQVLQAVSHINEKMFESGKVLLLSALSRPIQHKERVKLLLAYVHLQAKEFEHALSILDELEQFRLPINDIVFFLKGKALFELGRYKESSEALARVPQSSSRYTEARLLLGDCFMAQGDASGAEAIYKELLDTGKKDTSVMTKYAGALQAQGKTEEAVKILRIGYFSNIGAGRAPFLSALNTIVESLEASPEEKVLEARAYIAGFRFKEAMEAAQDAARIATDAKTRCEALALAARALSGQRKYREAVEEFEKILFGDCKDLVDAPYSLYHAIRSAMRASLNEKAWKFYETLTKEYSDSSFCDDVAVWFARGALRRGEYKLARKILFDALSRWPQGDMAMEARWLVALSFIMEKRYADARKVIEMALSKTQDPLSGSRFCYFLAWTDLVSGKTHKARQEFYKCNIAYPMTFYGFLAGMRAEKKGEKKLASEPGESSSKRRDGGRDASNGFPQPLRNAIWLYESGLFALAGEEANLFEPSSFEEAVVKSLILAKTRSGTQVFKIADSALKKFVVSQPLDENRAFFEIAFPMPYQNEVQRAAKESHVDPLLIYAVMREESAFSPQAVSPAGAIGLLQLMPATAQTVAKKLKLNLEKRSLFEPATNIRLGARFLSELKKSLGHPFFVIAGYNAGPGAVMRWKKENPNVPPDLFVELIGAEETRNYVKKVFSSYCAYHLLYDKKKPFLKVELGHGLH